MLASQLTNELRALFPNNAVEFFVSYYDYYLPEAFNSASDTYIDKVPAVQAVGCQLQQHACRLPAFSRFTE